MLSVAPFFGDWLREQHLALSRAEHRDQERLRHILQVNRDVRKALWEIWTDWDCLWSDDDIAKMEDLGADMQFVLKMFFYDTEEIIDLLSGPALSWICTAPEHPDAPLNLHGTCRALLQDTKCREAARDLMSLRRIRWRVSCRLRDEEQFRVDILPIMNLWAFPENADPFMMPYPLHEGCEYEYRHDYTTPENIAHYEFFGLACYVTCSNFGDMYSGGVQVFWGQENELMDDSDYPCLIKLSSSDVEALRRHDNLLERIMDGVEYLGVCHATTRSTYQAKRKGRISQLALKDKLEFMMAYFERASSADCQCTGGECSDLVRLRALRAAVNEWA